MSLLKSLLLKESDASYIKTCRNIYGQGFSLVPWHLALGWTGRKAPTYSPSGLPGVFKKQHCWSLPPGAFNKGIWEYTSQLCPSVLCLSAPHRYCLLRKLRVCDNPEYNMATGSNFQVCLWAHYCFIVMVWKITGTTSKVCRSNSSQGNYTRLLR